MKRVILRQIITVMVLGLPVVSGCTSTGPNVTDPAINERSETALFAVRDATGSGEILRYSEASGVLSTTDYLTANGVPLGKPIDAMYEAYDTLYLTHRASGTITAVELATRKKVGELTGFHADVGEGLCGMAFSNRSDGWAVSYGIRKLYPFDAYNLVVLPTVDLPGSPTAVGTSGTRVYVGMQLPDGSGAVVVLSSNGGYKIEQTLTFPTPIIAITGTYGGAQALLVSSGGPGADSANIGDDLRPTLYLVGTAAPVSVLSEVPLFFSASMHQRIGKPQAFLAVARDDYIYLAIPGEVLKIDARSLAIDDNWSLPGEYDMITSDFFSGLVYAGTLGSSTVKRITSSGEALPDLTLPENIYAMRFVSGNKVR